MYDLENIVFKNWWIRKYCHQIIDNPLFQPTQQDFEDFLDETIANEKQSQS